MNRRGFLKFLGISAATAAVAPKMLANSTNESMEIKDWIWKNEWGPLVTWHEPNGPADYSIGVEVGSGLEHSPSCVSVMRIGGIGEPDRQVAEFVSNTITPADFALVVAQIANKYKANCTDPRGPILVIEQVRGYGDLVQSQLQIMGFTRFFSSQSRTGRIRHGFYSNKVTNLILVGRFVEAVDMGWCKPNSFSLKNAIDRRETDKELLSNTNFMAAVQSYTGAHEFNKLSAITRMQTELRKLQMVDSPIKRKDVMERLDANETAARMLRSIEPIAKGIAQRIKRNA